MRFPKLLEKAYIYNNKVIFSYEPNDIDDLEIAEYQKWKGSQGIKNLTKDKLVRLYKNRLFMDEIESLLKREILVLNPPGTTLLTSGNNY